MDKKEEFVLKLACFGCEYKDDCTKPIQSGKEQCDRCYEDANRFFEKNKNLLGL